MNQDERLTTFRENTALRTSMTVRHLQDCAIAKVDESSRSIKCGHRYWWSWEHKEDGKDESDG